MRTILFGQAECLGNPVYYELLAEDWNGDAECYGLRVRRGGEMEEIAGLTVSQRRIQGLLESLVRGAVTPAALRDVVEDWIAV